MPKDTACHSTNNGGKLLIEWWNIHPNYSIPFWQAYIPRTAHRVGNERFLRSILIQIEAFQPIIPRRETPQQQSSTPSRHNNLTLHEKSLSQHGISLYFCFSYIIFTALSKTKPNNLTNLTFTTIVRSVASCQSKRY